MAHCTHQCQSPTLHTATPDAVARKINHPRIDLNRPAPDDPMGDQDPNSSFSDCKADVSAGQSGTPSKLFIGSRLVEWREEDKVYRFIKENFVSRLAEFGVQVTLVAIHRNCDCDVLAKARAKTFLVYSRAVQKKGDDNVASARNAWYATSKEEASKILSYGFGYNGKPENNGLDGCGVYFSAFDHPLESVMSSPIDEDGLRHLLLCRVILGKSEIVSSGSEQLHPSSKECESGVDDLSFPISYKILSSHMNTHVVPLNIVSFRVPGCMSGFLKTPEKLGKSTTPWLLFSILIWELSKILPASHVRLIIKYRNDHNEGKIPRHELIQKFRQIAGDRLLAEVFQILKTKQSGV